MAFVALISAAGFAISLVMPETIGKPLEDEIEEIKA